LISLCLSLSVILMKTLTLLAEQESGLRWVLSPGVDDVDACEVVVAVAQFEQGLG